jgi:quercetin dioxygenase-like cupin family protein
MNQGPTRVAKRWRADDSVERLDRPYGAIEILTPRDGEFAALQCVRVRLDPGRATRAHSHPNEEIFVVLAGELVFEGDTEDLDAVAGDIVTVPANVLHSMRNGSEREEAVAIAALAPFRIPSAVIYAEERPDG